MAADIIERGLPLNVKPSVGAVEWCCGHDRLRAACDCFCPPFWCLFLMLPTLNFSVSAWAPCRYSLLDCLDLALRRLLRPARVTSVYLALSLQIFVSMLTTART